MAVVWAVFLGTAASLFALGLAGLRWSREHASVYRTVGRFLLALALVTALFPTGLFVLEPMIWAGLYVGVVAVFTVVMTALAVARKREERACN